MNQYPMYFIRCWGLLVIERTKIKDESDYKRLQPYIRLLFPESQWWLMIRQSDKAILARSKNIPSGGLRVASRADLVSEVNKP